MNSRIPARSILARFLPASRIQMARPIPTLPFPALRIPAQAACPQDRRPAATAASKPRLWTPVPADRRTGGSGHWRTVRRRHLPGQNGGVGRTYRSRAPVSGGRTAAEGRQPRSGLHTGSKMRSPSSATTATTPWRWRKPSLTAPTTPPRCGADPASSAAGRFHRRSGQSDHGPDAGQGRPPAGVDLFTTIEPFTASGRTTPEPTACKSALS